jgi:hypothetical protein
MADCEHSDRFITTDSAGKEVCIICDDVDVKTLDDGEDE